MTTVNRKKALSALMDMEQVECNFWACEGPNVPFKAMGTCRVCIAIQTLREALGYKATEQVPNGRTSQGGRKV